MRITQPFGASLFLFALAGVANGQTATLSVVGNIRSTPAGIDCGSGGPCSADFLLGTTVSLTFTGTIPPDPGQQLPNAAAFGWDSVDSMNQPTQDACYGLGSCSVVMNQGKTVTYSVFLLDHQLGGEPEITSISPGSASVGQAVTVTIQASGLLPQYNTYIYTKLYIGTDLCNGFPMSVSVQGGTGPTTGTFTGTIPANRLTRAGLVPVILDALGATCGSDRAFSHSPVGLSVGGGSTGGGGGAPTDPGPSAPATCGSPVEVATGNFFYSTRQLFIPSFGPALNLTLTYNSQDARQGPFGNGWSHMFDQRIVIGNSGAQVFATCSQENGKRDKYTRNTDGSFASPPYVHSTLVQNPDGSFMLRNKNGFARRFDSSGKLVALVDRNGNTLSLGYDSTGFLTTATDASGRIVRFAKGANGLVQTVTDPANRVFRYAYDGSGNLTGITDPLGNTATFQFDSSKRMTAMVDPRGNAQMRIGYDGSGRVSTLVEGAETFTYSYSPSTMTTAKVDSVGNSYSFVYLAAGSITQRMDSLNHAETSVYDGDLNVTRFTNKNGSATNSTFDGMGNVLTVTDALGGVRRFTYDPVVNFPLTAVDALGNTARFQYDSRGNLTQATNPANFSTRLQYDAKGQLIKSINAEGNTTTLTRDSYGNVVRVVDPLGHASSATYDVLGRVLSTTDAEGHTSQITYDADGRLIRSVNAQGGITSNDFDASGNLTAVTLPNGKRTTFAYDALNRLVNTINPLNQSTAYSYDRRSNLSAKTDPKGQQFVYSYDSIDRLVGKTMPGDAITYAYDNVGNLLGVSDGDSALRFGVDVLNRVIQASTGPMPAQPTTTIRYGYNANGNRSSMTDPAGGVTSYSYDPRSLLRSITETSGFTAIFAYDSLSRRTELSRIGGATARYAYDDASRLLSLDYQSRAGRLGFDYSYDRVGNRLTARDNEGLNAYTYDAKYQLTRAIHRDDDNPQEFYVYDPVGNRTSSQLSRASAYDAANRLTSDSRFDYSYDANGNLISKKERGSNRVTAFTYDAENRLIKIDFPNRSSTSYRYDGLGRRFEKNVNGRITRYVYDGLEILTTNTAAGAVTARFTHGPGIDELLAVSQGRNTSLYETDALGSVVRLVNGNDASRRITYDSFGRIINSDGGEGEDDDGPATSNQPYAFQGREFDRESGLYYFRARYYDPQTGRFITEDPIGFKGGSNFYGFVGNNPVAYSDPAGLVRSLIDRGVQGFTGLAELSLGVATVFGSPVSGPATPFLAVSGAIGIQVGIGNVVAAFAPDTPESNRRVCMMRLAPSTAPQALARIAGGLEAQELTALSEGFINITTTPFKPSLTTGETLDFVGTILSLDPPQSIYPNKP